MKLLLKWIENKQDTIKVNVTPSQLRRMSEEEINKLLTLELDKKYTKNRNYDNMTMEDYNYAYDWDCLKTITIK